MDNLHLQMSFSYRKMKSPSMQLSTVDNEGAILVYRSGRSGFSKYFTGQLIEIATSFYKMDLKVRILDSQNDNAGGTAGPIDLGGGLHEVIVKFRLDFDNREYMALKVHADVHPSQKILKDITMDLLFELFPFALLIDREMRICGAGEKIVDAWSANNNNKAPNLLMGMFVKDSFKVRRPGGIVFDWDTVSNLTTVLFELALLKASSARMKKKVSKKDMSSELAKMDDRKDSKGNKTLLLKGQMMYIKDIDALIYLCR